MARLSQLVARPCWKSGFGSYGEQPLPPSAQADSLHPRGELSEVSVVPPTATTFGLVAGQLVTLPASPVLAVTATPGWS